MADLAESLNTASANPQAGSDPTLMSMLGKALMRVNPITAVPAAIGDVAGNDWWKRMGDYLKDTNWGDVAEGFARTSAFGAPLAAAHDVYEEAKANPDQSLSDTLAKGLSKERFTLSQGAHVPTDVAAGGVSLYPMAVTAGNLASNAVGGPVVDLGQKQVADFANTVRESSTPLVDAMAGRPSESGELLRGSPEEIGGHIGRTVGGFLPVGVPSWLSNLAKINTGSKYINAAGDSLKHAIEVVTPLALSSNPTLKTVMQNAAFGTGGSVLFEGAEHIAADREAERKEAATLSGAPPFTDSNQPSPTSKQATVGTQGPNTFAPSPLDAPAASADGIAKSAHDVAAEGVTHPITAGIVPSTGSTAGDIALAALGAAGLLHLYRRDLTKMAADKTGATKLTTSYDPANPLEATNMPLGVLQKQQALNRSESLSEVMRQVEAEKGKTPSQIRETVREWEENLASHQGASVAVKAGTFFNEGKFMDNPNISLSRPYNDHAVEVAQVLTPQQKSMFDYELHYSNELTNRENTLKQMFQTPGARNYKPGASFANVPHEAIASNLGDVTTSDLRAGIAQARSDPLVARLADEHREINQKLIRYAGQEGTFQQARVAQFIRDNPNYVPPNIPKTVNFLDAHPIDNQQRSLSPATGKTTPIPGRFEPTGTRTMKELGDPLALQARYAEEIFRKTDGEKMKRDFMNYLEGEATRGNQVAADMLGRDRANAVSDYKMVRWRDRYGNSKQREVNDAAVRDSLNGLTNPTALQMTRGVISKLTGTLESGAVGPLSLAGGQTFPIRSAMYSVTGGAVLSRPRGISMGWLDKGTRTLTEKLSGGRISAGIPDIPTFAADALLYRAPINVVATTAGHLGNALHNAVLKNSFVARAMTPARAQQFANVMRNHYLNSALHGEIQHGLTGPSSMESMTRSNVYSDPTNAFRAHGKLALSYHYLRDVMHSISAAPAQSIRAMNKNMPEWVVNSAIRNLSGDVGRSGAFRKLGGEPGVSAGAHVVRNTPWGNTYLQSGDKTLSSFNAKRDPAETARVVARIMTSVVTPSAMLAFWAAALGPEYAEYMYSTDTPENRTSKWFVPIPGLEPTRAWRPTIEPWMRPFKHLGEVIAGHLIGAYSGELYKDQNADVRKAIGDAVFHKDHTLSKDSIPNTLANQVLMPPMSPAISIPMGFLGIDARGYGDVKMPQPTSRKAGYTEGTGKDPTGNLLGMSSKDWFDTLAQSVGATGAQALLDYFREAGHAIDLGAGPRETVERVGQVINQRTKDSLDVAGSGPILDNARGIVPSHSGVSVLAMAKANTMNTISDNYTATMDHGVPRGDVLGDKKKIGIYPSQGPGPPPPPDQDTANFSAQVKRINDQMKPYRTQVNNMYEDLNRIKHNYAYSPEERRARSEVVSYQIINANKSILADQRRYEAILSQRFGLNINFDNYTPGVSIHQQYKPLTGGVSRPGDYPAVR